MLHPRAYLRQSVDSLRPTAILERESRPVQQVMLVGDEHGWRFKVLCQAPMPTGVVRGPNAFLLPVQLDHSPVPARTQERVQALYSAGIRPKGFVIVHEAPNALPGKRLPTWKERVDAAWEQVEPQLARAAKASLPVVATVLKVSFVIALTLVTGIVTAAAAGLTSVDPVLVAVTEDNVWIEIDRWDVS